MSDKVFCLTCSGPWLGPDLPQLSQDPQADVTVSGLACSQACYLFPLAARPWLGHDLPQMFNMPKAETPHSLLSP